MSLLSTILSGVLKGVMGQAQSSITPDNLSKIFGNTDFGNIASLLAMLQKSGLDDQVASWLGNGANKPVSTNQLESALGTEQLEQIARSAGLPIDGLLGQLSQNLPGIIDAMSPKGKLEE